MFTIIFAEFITLLCLPYFFLISSFFICYTFITHSPANTDAATFGAWSESKFAPEEEFLSKVKSIAGVSTVETQTYTLMDI